VIIGTEGVKVNRGVGVRVMVGEAVGVSGVDETAAVSDACGMGVALSADCVNTAFMVWAMAVLTKLASGVFTTVMVGATQASETTNKAMTDKWVGLDVGISASFQQSMQRSYEMVKRPLIFDDCVVINVPQFVGLWQDVAIL
jgi:hypothetical protein